MGWYDCSVDGPSNIRRSVCGPRSFKVVLDGGAWSQWLQSLGPPNHSTHSSVLPPWQVPSRIVLSQTTILLCPTKILFHRKFCIAT